jgi:hypothetical protein
MPTSTSNKPAQTALGKFYLHPWDSQVLVDWAKSVVQQGMDGKEVVQLSKMDRADREKILEQFGTVVLVNNLDVSFDELTAAKTYLNDLRTRVLADKIDPEAAFAQVRPLAYDLEGIQLSGLSELDEDLNLLDSGQAPWHNKTLIPANKNVFIRRFFREMRILEPLPVGKAAERRPFEPAEDFEAYLEAGAYLVLGLVLLLLLLGLLSGLAI